MPTLPTHPISLPETLFLCAPMKKILKGTRFASEEEVRPQTAEALKGINTNVFKNRFEPWEKPLDNSHQASNTHVQKVHEEVAALGRARLCPGPVQLLFRRPVQLLASEPLCRSPPQPGARSPGYVCGCRLPSS